MHAAKYAVLFAALGFEPTHHPHRFFYLREDERCLAMIRWAGQNTVAPLQLPLPEQRRQHLITQIAPASH